MKFFRVQPKFDVKAGSWLVVNTHTMEVIMDSEPAKVALPKFDPVSRPAHYTSGKIEVIDFIEDQGLGKGFCLGNAIKYLARAGKKDPDKIIEDLEKAAWYLNRQIEKLRREEQHEMHLARSPART